jgi:hypothetical protein
MWCSVALTGEAQLLRLVIQAIQNYSDQKGELGEWCQS